MQLRLPAPINIKIGSCSGAALKVGAPGGSSATTLPLGTVGTGTVEEGNFVLEYNFLQKKFFFARIIAHLFIIVEGNKFFFSI